MAVDSKGREHAWREGCQGMVAAGRGGRGMGITVLVSLLLTLSGLLAAAAEPLPSELDSLRLSAIAWFAEPARRVVVINDAVLKQGESMGPFTVREIRPAEVEIAYQGSLFVKTVAPVDEGREPTPGAPSPQAPAAGAALARRHATSAPPLDPPPQAERGLRYHEVRAGENLFRIGMSYNLKVETLRRLNNLPAEVTIVRPGQRLVVGPASDP